MIRRVNLSSIRKDGERIVADIAGLNGEDFEAEVWFPAGYSALIESETESVCLFINNDFNNAIALCPGWDVLADQGQVVLSSQNGSEIYLEPDGSVRIVGSGGITVEGDMQVSGSLTTGGAIDASGSISTSGSVTASGDVQAGSVSLQNHIHPGVEPGGGTTGGPI